MRSLTAAPAKEEKAMKPYPAFSQAIQEVAKDVDQLTKEGEVLCQKEMQTVQDPNKREILTDFVDFLRNVRQYWKVSVKTVEKLPAKTPGWLTLLADPKEFFRSDKEVDDLDEFVPGHDREQSAKRKKSVEAFAKAFAADCKVKQIPIPKLEDDQVTIDNYIKALARYIQTQKTPLLDKGNIINLIQEVSQKLVGDEIDLTSDHIKSVLTPKAKASIRGLSKTAAEDSWSEWKGKAQKISEKIEKLIPLYRALNEAWMPKVDSDADPFSKNRKMLRNFFVGAQAGSGLRFYGRDVLVPNIDMYLYRIYGKEETPEQEQKNQALEQKTEVLHVQEFLKDFIETDKVKFTEGAEKIKEGLDKKIDETTDEEDKKKLQDVEKKVEEVGSQIYQKFEELENPDITDEQREEIAKKAEQVFEKFKGIEVELDTIIKETAKPENIGKNWTPPRIEREQVASGFRSLSVYAAEPEDKTPSWFKPFGGIVQQVKQMADKVKQWVGSEKEVTEEPKEGELTPEQERQVKQKLTEVYQEYKGKILEGVDSQIEALKSKSGDPTKDAKVNALLDAFIEKLPEALDVQMAKYQETLPLLLGGNKSVQEHFKDDSEKIIEELFKKHVTDPAAKIATKMFRLRADLALNDKAVMQKVQKDVLKLDKNALDKILVDSFKATIDKNKEEVEALLSNSEK